MKRLIISFLWLFSIMAAQSQVKLNLLPDNYGADLSLSPYGIFFEEINHAADGGLWSEMIRNGSFENSYSYVDAWTGLYGTNLTLADTHLMNAAQEQYLHVEPSAEGAVIANTGYWGMRLDAQPSYTLTFFARADVPFSTTLNAYFLSDDEQQEMLFNASTDITINEDWQKFQFVIPDAERHTAKGFLILKSESTSAFDLDVVSLMPANTYKGHGCRTDLAQMLENLHPRFMRFPGGCYIEGQYYGGERNRFEWKKTIGPLEERPGHWNINWGYRSSDSFGYHEMLQLSEDLGATPLFVVNVGLGHGWYQDINDLDEFIQEALDAIEYANGSTSTHWGAIRAANGHPEPFGLKYIEIGNENYNYYADNNNDQSYQYAERYYMFYQAIKAAYPDIVCIGNVESWNTDNPSWRNSYPVDMVDEHYYRAPSWFAQNYEKYDTYDRTGPSIYVGEYAVTSNYGYTGNLAAALGEAIYMQGIERNADIVPMASYAPIFVNENSIQWLPDMIRFDATHSYGTPSYYVQSLMAQKLGTRNITWEESKNHKSSENIYTGLSTWNTTAQFTNYQISQDGKVIYRASFDNTDPWTDKAGTFYEKDGTLYQTSTSMQGIICLNESIALDDDYTIEVDATKTGGDEGFLIAFRYKNADNYCWWNLGGWNNRAHGIEQCVDGSKTICTYKMSSLEIGRTYHLRIDVKGTHIQCYLDGELYHDINLPEQRLIYTSASRDGNKLYVKLVNPTAETATTMLTTQGYSASNIIQTQMTAPTDQAENTADNMYNIVPRTFTLPAYGTNIMVNTPAYSFNIVEMDITPGENNDVHVMPAEGTYYLKDAVSGLYLSRGANWGTQATLSKFGLPIALTHTTGDLYTLRYHDLPNKYLGNLTYPFTDVAPGDETLWRFHDDDKGGLWLENTLSNTYFTCPAEGEGADFTDDTKLATRFQLVSPEVYELEMSNLNTLHFNTSFMIGKDISHLLKNASMEQGIEGWTNTFHSFYNDGSPAYRTTLTNRASVCEAFQLMGDLTQTITGLTPNGIYRFSIPAFFRAASNDLCAAASDEGITLGNAYLRCGDVTIPIKTWASDRTSNSSPNTMEEASDCFARGLYQNVVTGHADEHGTLTIGLGCGYRIDNQWLIWGAAKLEEVPEPVDYTSYIINPSFETTLTNGWENNGMQLQNNSEPAAGKMGNYYCEKWTPYETLDDAYVRQTLTGLPDGDYLVAAICHAELSEDTKGDVEGVYLFAGDSKTPIADTNLYIVVATVTDGQLTIGFGCEDTNAKWISVDHFHLIWIGSSVDNNKEALKTLIEKLQQLIDTKTILSQQQRDEAAQVISDAQAATTADEIEQAISQVNAKYEELDAYRLTIERNEDYNAYLFAYFPSNKNENLYYALSTDGFNYTPLNNGQAIILANSYTLTGGMRDPHILRGEDGIFRMVATDMVSDYGWDSNRGIVMSKSTDLIHWTHSTIHFPTRFPEGWSNVTRVWAPETIYDREAGKYMVYFSLLTNDGTCPYDKVFYCYANEDFTDLEDYPVHFFDRSSATIDADIIYDETDQLYHMIYKNEGIASISHVSAPYLTAREGQETGSQWGPLGGGIQQTSVAVEGGGIFRLINQNTYVVMYDCYGSGYYQFCTTDDWKTYTLKAQTTTSGMFTPRHGSVIPLHPSETRALLNAFPTDGFDIDCGEATGISATQATTHTQQAAPLYNLNGQRVDDTYKGIVIQDSKKFIKTE